MVKLRPLIASLVLLSLLSGCTILLPSITISGRIVRDHSTSSNLSSASGMSTLAESTAADLPAEPGRLVVGLEPEGFSTQAGPTIRTLALNLAAGRSGQVRLLEVIEGARVAVFDTPNMRSAALELQADSNVRYVEEDVVFQRLSHSTADDPYLADQWALTRVSADDAWHNGNMGEGTTVAIIDVGFQPGHEDLVDNEAFSYNFRYQTSTVQAEPECNSHGQHVSGIVAATRNNGIGVSGIAPSADFLFLDVSASGTEVEPDCPIRLSSIVSALDWVTGSSASGPRADIVNISLGSGSYSQTLWDSVFRAYRAGITVVAAAGNSSTNQVMYPAAFPEVMAVSATGRYDELAYYSNTGSEIFLSAPGGNDHTGLIVDDRILSTLYDSGSDEYGYMEGTSMASPLVAGIAALVIGINPQLSPLDVSTVLAKSTVDLGSSGWDSAYGYGRPDAAAAVARAASAIPVSNSYRLRTNYGHDLRIPFHGEFSLNGVPLDALVLVESDDDGDGVYGEYGEYGGLFQVDSSNADAYNLLWISPID